MPSRIEEQAVWAYFCPEELTSGQSQGRRVVSEHADLLALLEQDITSVVIVYPLLSVRDLRSAQRIQAWQAFYQPFVSLRLRGAKGLRFVPLNQSPPCEPLMQKLGCLLYPDAFELQDQLELNASDLNRDPVFSPTDTRLHPDELMALLSRIEHPIAQPADETVPRLVDSIYKNKADVLEAQLELLQSEFSRAHEELESLRTESLLTADLILKAGSSILKG
jgi:hypothetical protein